MEENVNLFVLCVMRGRRRPFRHYFAIIRLLFRRSLRFTRSPYTLPTTAIRPTAAAIIHVNIICFDDTDELHKRSVSSSRLSLKRTKVYF